MALPTMVDELKSPSHRYFIPDAELLSNFAEEDEKALDSSTDSDTSDDDSELTDHLQRIQTRSDQSNVPTQNFVSRAYKFVRLEHELTMANLLSTREDQIEFQHEYRQSLRDNTFEKFLQKFNEKLQQQQEKLRSEHARKTFRTFTFVNLEENFLALDPTYDIKIVFLDDSTSSSSRLTYRNHQSARSNQSKDDAVEAFYQKRSRCLLRNPSRARDRITLYARRAGERLQERLPYLSRVPHRVKIVDQREIKSNYDQHILQQMEHRTKLEIINKRRQLVQQMINQSRKNEQKMRKLNFQTPLTMMNSTNSQGLFKKINEIEQIYQHSHLNFPTRTTSYSSTQTSSPSNSLTSSFSSSSTPCRTTLSTYHLDKSKDQRRLLPFKRPLTASIH